jgi:hypothetical protein
MKNVQRFFVALQVRLLFVAALSAGSAMATTVTFNTVGTNTWIVPAGVTSISIVAIGGGGGAGSISGGNGGNGGRVTATIVVVPNDSINFAVGGGGAYGGGGGGGGGSSVVTNTTTATTLLIAGGGGGGGFSLNPTGGAGGDGNGSNGANGSGGGPGGGGGSAGVGGAAGGGTSTAGSATVGGIGIGSSPATGGTEGGVGGNSPGGFGGGGGAGYGGGGGSGSAGFNAGGGGGGGSFGTGTFVVSVGSNAGIQSSGGNGSIVVTYTSPYTAPPAPPIPAIAGLPPVAGIGSQPTVLDLSGGEGPAMTACLVNTVRAILGADATYLGQTANGIARISQSGRVISFYPIDASTNSSGSADIRLGTSYVLNVGTSCGNFNVVPAIFNLTEFGAVLNGMGVAARIDAKGVITLTVNGTVYVAIPDYFVSKGTPGTPSLVKGSDGLYRFTDSAGNVQILRPAFLDIDALGGQVPLALNMYGWTIVQTDGTAVFQNFSNQQFVLTPDLTLSAAPASASLALWWADGPNRFVLRSSTFTLGQGFTVRAR